jgi:peroxiredoxin
MVVLKALRMIAATASGIVGGVLHAAKRRTVEPRAALNVGDHAPDFSLRASNGRTYRLRDLVGRVVVIAWFPKAFTGG